jgi:predicted AAA+ superfamily ATPase
MRRKLLDQLIAWKSSESRKPLILYGARQVGKTFLLRQFGADHFPHVHYFNFEKSDRLQTVFEQDLDPGRIVSALGFAIDQPIGRDSLIVFDEIQECPRALTSLKYFCEELPAQAVCAAGSLLGVRHGNSESFPVGKVASLHLYPMDFEEFCWACGDARATRFLADLGTDAAAPSIAEITPTVHEHLWEMLKQYMVTGGLPEIVSLFAGHRADLHAAFSLVRARQSELVNAYLADMAKHAGSARSVIIERVFRNVPTQLARETGRFRFNGVTPGIRGYAQLAGPIDWLVASRLVIKVMVANRAEQPLSAYAKENAFKLYVFDMGILGALAGISPQELAGYAYGRFKGAYAENLAATEFMSSGCERLYSWAERESEVEFLRETGGRIIPVEVKAGLNTKAKSLSVFIDQYHPPLGVVMSAVLPPPSQSARKRLYLPLYCAGKLEAMLGRAMRDAP